MIAALAGTGTLVRLALRRDRIWLSAWILLAVGLVAATASSMRGLYPTLADRQQYADSTGSSAAAAVFSGPGFGLTTLGGIVVKEGGATALLLVTLVSIMLAVRYTRTEEETGRAELVGAAGLGRYARLAAALLVVGGADVTTGTLIAVALAGYGLPVAGSCAFAFALAATGWLFAAVAAVAAQCIEHARTATGSAAAVFGLAFIMRGVGDASAVANDGGSLANLSWLSPAGWFYQVRAFDGERWWVFAPLVGGAAALVALAAIVSVRRDLEAGLISPRLGRAEGTPRLASPWAMAWRLQRGSLIGWTVGVAVGGAVFGAVARDIGDMVGNNEDAAQVLADLGGAGPLVDSYLAWLLSVTGVATAAYAVAAIARLRSEESGLRAEPVLATAVKRWQWMASHLVVALAGALVVLVTTGLAVGLVHGLRSGSLGHELARVLAGALVQVPAVLVLGAGAVALFGLLPRFTYTAWAAVVVSAVIGQLGAVLGLDRWAIDLSPFSHLPKVPGSEIAATPLIWLMGLAAGLIAAGAVGFRQRDVGRT